MLSLLPIQVSEIEIEGKFNSQPSMRLSEYEDGRNNDTNQSNNFLTCAALIPVHMRALYTSQWSKKGEMGLH